jgi:hypothetical protein
MLDRAYAKRLHEHYDPSLSASGPLPLGLDAVCTASVAHDRRSGIDRRSSAVRAIRSDQATIPRCTILATSNVTGSMLSGRTVWGSSSLVMNGPVEELTTTGYIANSFLYHINIRTMVYAESEPFILDKIVIPVWERPLVQRAGGGVGATWPSWRAGRTERELNGSSEI